MKKLLLLLLLPMSVWAWEPVKPVAVVVGFAPGSGNELAFRQASSIVQKNNPKVVFVIENKPGADAVISQNHMMTVPADGSLCKKCNWNTARIYGIIEYGVSSC